MTDPTKTKVLIVEDEAIVASDIGARKFEMLLRRGLLHGGREAKGSEVDATRKRIAVIDLARKTVADIQNRARVERINRVQRDVVVVAIGRAATGGCAQVSESVERGA